MKYTAIIPSFLRHNNTTIPCGFQLRFLFENPYFLGSTGDQSSATWAPEAPFAWGIVPSEAPSARHNAEFEKPGSRDIPHPGRF